MDRSQDYVEYKIPAPFIPEHRSLVMRLCQEDLAGLIYRHIGWNKERPREKMDWNLAGQFLVTSSRFMGDLDKFTLLFLLGSSERHLKDSGKSLPDKVDGPMLREIVDSLDYDKKKDYEGYVLGRFVWELFWTIKNHPAFHFEGYTGYHD